MPRNTTKGRQWKEVAEFIPGYLGNSTDGFYLYFSMDVLYSMGLMSDEDVQYFTDLKNQWKESLENLELPEVKKLKEKKLKEEIMECEADLLSANEIERQGRYVLDNKCPSNERWFWDAVLDVLFVQPLRAGREEKIKYNRFKLSKKTDDKTLDIEKAKTVSITDFIKINSSGFAKCPLHEDKTPSFKYYPKQNSFYCFSCHQGGSVIDFIMVLKQCDFKSAVLELIK